MWPVLLAAAVAGTTICAKNLFFNNNRHPTASPPPPQTEQKTHDKCDQNRHQPNPVLLAAVVAGTGICAKNLFFNNNRHPTVSPPPPQTEQKTHDECDQNRHQPVSNVISQSNQSGDVGRAEEIVRFSSSGVSKKPRNRLRGFKKKVKVERLSRCFKKKRTSKNAFVKSSTG